MFDIRTKINIIWQHAKYFLCFYAPKQQALTSYTIHQKPFYTHAQSTQTAPTVHAQSAQTKPQRADAHAQISQAKCVGAAPVCPPERPRSGVSMPKIHTLCAGMKDGCALAGRHGRAHRHRPYHFSCGSVS